MVTALADDFLMAQAVADAIGATKRQVQLWTDAGAIRCIPESDRQGRGRQRRYDRSELPVAALVAAMARCKLPIGHLLRFSDAIRDSVENRGSCIEDGGLLLLEISDEPMPWFVWCGDEHILGMCFIEHEMTEAVVIDVSKAIAGLGEEGTAK